MIPKCCPIYISRYRMKKGVSSYKEIEIDSGTIYWIYLSKKMKVCMLFRGRSSFASGGGVGGKDLVCGEETYLRPSFIFHPPFAPQAGRCPAPLLLYEIDGFIKTTSAHGKNEKKIDDVLYKNNRKGLK